MDGKLNVKSHTMKKVSTKRSGKGKISLKPSEKNIENANYNIRTMRTQENLKTRTNEVVSFWEYPRKCFQKKSTL